MNKDGKFMLRWLLITCLSLLLQGCAAFKTGTSVLDGVELVETVPADVSVYVHYVADNLASGSSEPVDKEEIAVDRNRVQRALSGLGLKVVNSPAEATHGLLVQEVRDTRYSALESISIPLWMFSAFIIPGTLSESAALEYQVIQHRDIAASTSNTAGIRFVYGWLLTPFMFTMTHSSLHDVKEDAHREAIIDLINQGAFEI